MCIIQTVIKLPAPQSLDKRRVILELTPNVVGFSERTQ
jgi:hypothetical protein